jgi:hypothetical protein
MAVLTLGILLPSQAASSSTDLSATATSLLLQIMSAEAGPSSIALVPNVTRGFGADARFEPLPLAASCTIQCRSDYLGCMDGCDASPFPGCADHCRFDILYPCYASCF